jgi:hypothetical protein
VTRRLWGACLLAIAVLALSAWPSLLSMVDDAYVALRYARNLALGNGPVYNAGEPPVEGYTDFLWVVWMAPGTRLPIHPSGWATGWGLVFGAGALVAATGLGTVLCGRGSPWALVPAAVLAALPVFGIAVTNGLETGMYVALVLGAAWAVLDGRVPWLGGALAGLLYLVRPEGLAVGLGLVLVPILRAPAGATRRDLRPALALLAVAVPYFVARTVYFGTLIPNTFAAQARKPFFDMWTMNESYYARSAPLYGGTIVAWLLAFVFGPRTLAKYALLGIAAGLTLLSMRVYNWMPGARLFLAPIALTLAAFAPTLQALPRAPRTGLVAALGIGTLVLSLGPSRAVETTYDAHNTVRPGNAAERMARAIAATAPKGAWLLARDAGVVPYFVGPDVDVIDIHPFSLTDPHLTGKRFDVDYVLGHDPAWIVTTANGKDALPTMYPEERALLRDPRVKGHFTEGTVAEQHHRRWYALWTRDDLAAK